MTGFARVLAQVAVVTDRSDWVGAVQDVAYLAAAVLFIVGIKRLASPRTARGGNVISAVGMLIAVVATLYLQHVVSLAWILGSMVVGAAIGAALAVRIQMTAMPQLVGLFNGFGGLASVLVAGSEYIARYDAGRDTLAGAEALPLTFDAGLTIGLSILIGSVTFTGSMVAWAKLQGVISGRPRQVPGHLWLNAIMAGACVVGSLWLAIEPAHWPIALVVLVVSNLLGLSLVMGIGGADMPVVVALLNSYSGLAAAATGFILFPPNKALVVSGSLVGASGIVLTAIMCKAMNRSLANVLFGGVGTDGGGTAATTDQQRVVRSTDPEELAILLEDVRRVVIVPGYGMAVAQAQHAVRDLYNKLTARGCEVGFGIHPVAGRMPGHMNVLLAEVDVPYDRLWDLDQTNAELERTDVALVIGANDVVNPAARHDRSSPIYGMPILDVDKARTVVVCKRSLAAGYAGVENELFFQPNTLMLFGDAKKTIGEVVQAMA